MPGNPGPAGPRGPQGLQGVKGEPGQSPSAPSLPQPPIGVTVNESQTAILKCTADGYPPPKITWSKLISTLPDGRYVAGSSGALIVKDVRPGDDGVYRCKAENVLGSVNATARLTVQCKYSVIRIRGDLEIDVTTHFNNTISTFVSLELNHSIWLNNTLTK